MKVADTIEQAQNVIHVKRVFGEAYEKDGVTVIPAAWVAGGGGGGNGSNTVETGEGGGFGVAAFPVGAYIIKDGDVSWRPAINVNMLILSAFFTLRTIVKARARRRR